jgi:hypothetical protein
VPKFIPSDIEFAIASGGGVATLMLGDFFSRRHRVNAPSDEDGFKHMPIPPVSFNPRFRWVFIYGDPVAATVSLFRRGYHGLQSRKLQRGYKPYCPIPLCMTLEEYAAQGKDLLHFERQFQNYFERHQVHPTLFLRYDAIWSNLDKLGAFLGICPTEMAEFPPRAARKSEELIVARETLEKLYEIYRPFVLRLNDLPDAFVRGEGQACGAARVACTKNFQLAVKNGIVSRLKPVTGPYGE